MEPEERLRLANYCFGCGQLNPDGLKLRVTAADGRARAIYHAREEHQGFPGLMHGGLIATLLDEVMGWAMYSSGIWAVTGKMDLRYRRPIPLGTDLAVEAAVTKQHARGLVAHGEVRALSSDELLVESKAIFVRVAPKQEEQLAFIYQPDLLL